MGVIWFFMATIALKDIPLSIHTALKRRAKQHGRSLNKEALACLESSISPAKINTQALLVEIRQHRASLPGRLDDRLLQDYRV